MIMTEMCHLRSHLLSAKAAYEKAWETPDAVTKVALFNSMLFECGRARRIARDAPETLATAGLDRDELLEATNAVAELRNVIEHWTDPKKPRPTSMAMHEVGGLTVATDETSIIILGREAVLKGKLNLYDVYRFVCATLERMKPANDG
jgi:hypothetical protein